MALLANIACRHLRRHHLNPSTLSHAVRNYADVDVEDKLVKQPSPQPLEPSPSVASTLANIKYAKTPQDVLQAVQHKIVTLEHGHLMDAFRAIFRLYKSQDVEDQAQQQLTKDKSFQVFCEMLKHRSRALDANDTIEAFKILTYLQVPITAPISKTILELLRGHLNTFNIRQVMFLHFLLTKHGEKNHLVDALKLALPLVFQIHLPLEIDTDDFNLLKDMLVYSAYHKLPDKCINNIVTGLLLYETLNLDDAKVIMWNLSEINCDSDKFPSRALLLKKCYDVMADGVDKLKFEEVLRTLAKMKARVVDKHLEFYSERFADAAADYVIRNGLEFEDALLIGRVLARIAHTHLRLMEYLCKCALTHKDILANARANTLFSFINCLANNNYTPEETTWYMLQRNIDCNPILDVRTTALPWAKACLELASLGCYNDKLITKIFSQEFLSDFLNRENNKMDYIQLLTIQEAVKVFRPDMQCRLPESVEKRARELYPVHAVSAIIAEYLAYGLGSKDFVARNIEVPGGLVLDLLVAVKQCYPVQLKKLGGDTKTPIEQLDLNENMLHFGLLAFHRGCFSMNSNRLRGTFGLLIDILEKQGYLIVPINAQDWLDLPQSEKAPYLVRELRHKCSEVGLMLYTQTGYRHN